MSIKKELSDAMKDYNTNHSYEAFNNLRDKENEYNRTSEGVKKFKLNHPESLEAEILEKIEKYSPKK